jgi:Sulfatase-modifying factor enzyme 1
MSGNVSEWVADWFGPYSTEVLSNPTGPESGNEKVLKGCSWFFPPAYCRGAARPSVDPGARYDYLGFRCALLDAVKVASAVLKGLGGSNAPRLPDRLVANRVAVLLRNGAP